MQNMNYKNDGKEEENYSDKVLLIFVRNNFGAWFKFKSWRIL